MDSSMLTPSDQGPHILFTRYVKNKTNLDITCKSCAWCIPDVRMQMIRRWGQEQKKWLTCCGGPRTHDDGHADRAQCVPDVHTWTFNHTFTMQSICYNVNFPIKFMRSMKNLFQNELTIKAFSFLYHGPNAHTNTHTQARDELKIILSIHNG
jgi:hypothetical protein